MIVQRIPVSLIAWAATVVGAALPADALPAQSPHEQYRVGVARGEFVDDARLLFADDPASGARRLPAIVWYPAADRDGHARRDEGEPYLTDDAAAITLPAIARNLRYAVEDLHAMENFRVRATAGARAARQGRAFPVVVFSHGFFLYPEQNSALAVHLARHGYIVVSIAHPGDAADMRLADGRIAATKLSANADDPRMGKALKVLVEGKDLARSRVALREYAEAFPQTRVGRSFADWREDTLAVARVLADVKEPLELREALASADRSRFAFAGMSFGGATSATACKLIDACRAAINLDGQNFDPDLFDAPVGRPLLLMLSDWTRYSVLAGQPSDADFNPNDLAYERWSDAGRSGQVTRVRLDRIRHMGYTDFMILLHGPQLIERVGEILPDEATSAIEDLVLAFLDVHVRNADAAIVRRAIDAHPALRLHVPARLQRWVDER